MKDSLMILAEILISFFAVVGLAYLINDIADIIKYRGKHAGLPVLVDTAHCVFEEISELAAMYCRLMNQRGVRCLFGDMVLVHSEKSRVSLEMLIMLTRQYPFVSVVGADKLESALLGESENIVE